MFDIVEFISRLFKKENAGTQNDAKERLRLVLISDRANVSPHIMESLREELIEVISRYMTIDTGSMEMGLERNGKTMALAANIPVVSLKRNKEKTARKSAGHLRSASVETTAALLDVKPKKTSSNSTKSADSAKPPKEITETKGAAKEAEKPCDNISSPQEEKTCINSDIKLQEIKIPAPVQEVPSALEETSQTSDSTKENQDMDLKPEVKERGETTDISSEKDSPSINDSDESQETNDLEDNGADSHNESSSKRKDKKAVRRYQSRSKSSRRSSRRRSSE